MEKTHSFKLASGPECEVRPMIGKHQRWLTEHKDDMTVGLNKVLVDVIVRIGTKTSGFDENFVKELLSADKKKILVELRQFSLRHDPVFRFEWTYVDRNGEKQVLELVEDLKEGFPVHPTKEEYVEYADVIANKERTIVLEDCGKTVVYSLLDGKSEERAKLYKKKDMSSHTTIQMRNPREMRETDGSLVPIQLDLDNLSLYDIETLRKDIHNNEPRVDTEMMFEHPEAETKPTAEKNVIIDLLRELAFFFPSGRI